MAEQVGDNNAYLHWNFDENTPNALNIVVLREGEEIVQLPPSVTEYIDTDLASGNYQYEIYVTYDIYENSVSRFADVEIISNNPSDLTYMFGDIYNTIELTWIAPQNTQLLTGYQIYRDDELLEEIAAQTTYEDSGIPNGLHSYKVLLFAAYKRKHRLTQLCHVHLYRSRLHCDIHFAAYRLTKFGSFRL